MDIQDTCAARALPDEPRFTLLARDPQAPALLRAWARGRLNAVKTGERPLSDIEGAMQVFERADEMQAWRVKNAATAPWRQVVTQEQLTTQAKP